MMSICENDAFRLSTHAATRMAQRGIRPEILDVVLLHGTPTKAQRACEEFSLLERSARQLVTMGYDQETISAATKVRAIVDTNGTIVTCYHKRNARLRTTSRNARPRGTKHI